MKQAAEFFDPIELESRLSVANSLNQKLLLQERPQMSQSSHEALENSFKGESVLDLNHEEPYNLYAEFIPESALDLNGPKALTKQFDGSETIKTIQERVC